MKNAYLQLAQVHVMPALRMLLIMVMTWNSASVFSISLIVQTWLFQTLAQPTATLLQDGIAKTTCWKLALYGDASTAQVSEKLCN